MPFVKFLIATFLALTFIATPAMAEQPANAAQILMQNGIDPAHPGGSAHLFQQQFANGAAGASSGNAQQPQGKVTYRYKGEGRDNLLFGVPFPPRVFNNIPHRGLR